MKWQKGSMVNWKRNICKDRRYIKYVGILLVIYLEYGDGKWNDEKIEWRTYFG